MSQVAPNTETTGETRFSYAGNLEYLSDEMKRLDLLIQIRVFKQRKPASLLDQFRGLVLSEEEIDELLASAALPADNDSGSDSSADHSLAQALSDLDSHIQKRRACSVENRTYLPLAHLSKIFDLTPFEERCILACLAPELNRKYEKLFAYLQDDVTRKKPSVDLLLNLNCNTLEEKLAARMAFEPHATLLRHRILQMEEDPQTSSAPLLSRWIKLDDRVVSFLLGFGQIDSKLESLARLVLPEKISDAAGLNEEILRRASIFIRSHFGRPTAGEQNLALHFHGPYGSNARLLATAICGDLGLPLIVADVARILGGELDFQEAMARLGREALLQQAALSFDNFDYLITDDEKYRNELDSLVGVIQTLSRLTFMFGSKPWNGQRSLTEQVLVSLELPLPDEKERVLLWESLSTGHEAIASDVDIRVLASKFRLTSGQIQDALAAAGALALWRSPADVQITMADLHAACRMQSNPRTGKLARKLEPKYRWGDIVLPPDQMAQLTEVCNQARYRHIVYGEWGFDRKLSTGKGLNMLFSGPPGTGKTMAAEVIASELQLDLYKVDLSQVVSKYIGETEKNLCQVFQEAQAGSAILFFDEADALFGKRSEVKDAHDRYANIEVGYLLQEMEAYEGIAILATNLRHNLDEAFVRRMQFIIDFPFPDEAYRRRIWEAVFPREAPLASDVDFAALARGIKLAGGNIKNIALAAAFYAASDGEAIGMQHLVRAAHRESQKLGRTWNEAEWITQTPASS